MIDLAIAELHKGFALLNRHLFDGALEVPAILIQNQGRRKDILGWCSTREIWFSQDESKQLYEINITAEYVNRNPVDIMETMLHEMVHYYNYSNGIKDVSRGGAYHNKAFKEEAELRGLVVDYDKKLGWAITSLKAETAKLIEGFGIDPKAFKIARAFEGGTSKKSSLKYTCPECELTVRATKKVKVLCMECTQILVSEDEEEEDGKADD